MQKNGRRASRSEAEGNLFDAMPLWLPEGAWKVAGGEGSVATGNHRMKDTQHSRTGVPEGCWKAASALSPYVIRMVFNMAPLEHFSILLLVRFHPVMSFLIQHIRSDFFEAGCTCFVECSCRNGNGQRNFQRPSGTRRIPWVTFCRPVVLSRCAPFTTGYLPSSLREREYQADGQRSPKIYPIEKVNGRHQL
jgi:hypothetical protein